MATKQGNKQMYVSAPDVTWWQRGEELAKRQGLPFSKYIARLLRREVMNAQLVKPQTIEELRAELQRLRDEENRIQDLLLARIEAGDVSTLSTQDPG